MNPDVTSPTPGMDAADVSLDHDRAAAEQALEIAERNPILSGEQACAVAHVHALLAIEQRLAQLFAALVTPSSPSDHSAPDAALALLT